MQFAEPPEDRRLSHEQLIAREVQRRKDADQHRAAYARSKRRNGPGQRRTKTTPEN